MMLFAEPNSNNPNTVKFYLVLVVFFSIISWSGITLPADQGWFSENCPEAKYAAES